MKTIHILLIVIFTFSIQSCDIQKRALKNKTDRSVSEFTEQITKRKGDTVTYTIPNFKYKDTTIYTVNHQGTTLRTVYDNKGQISQIDCFASMIEEISRSNKQLIETIKDKNSEKSETFDSTIILYAVIGFSLFAFIVIFFIYKTINKHSTAIETILKQIT